MFTMFDEKARISDIFLGCILMQKNFCSLFTFPVFGSGSVYTLFVENVGHL